MSRVRWRAKDAKRLVGYWIGSWINIPRGHTPHGPTPTQPKLSSWRVKDPVMDGWCLYICALNNRSQVASVFSISGYPLGVESSRHSTATECWNSFDCHVLDGDKSDWKNWTWWRMVHLCAVFATLCESWIDYLMSEELTGAEDWRHWWKTIIGIVSFWTVFQNTIYKFLAWFVNLCLQSWLT